MSARAVIAVAVSILAAAPSAAAPSVERGHAFVAANCSRCHAIGPTGASPYAPAPPFRTLHERYDVSAIAEALAEGIVVGHEGDRQMPQFMLDPGQIDDVIAYLKSLEPPPKTQR
jgi:cytochrome c